MNKHGERRPAAFWWLAALFTLFVLFLYGPILTIMVLSFQGPSGGLTFPMNGVSTYWFSRLWQGVGVVDIWAAFGRSFRLGVVVMLLTVAFALPAGLAFRKRFPGQSALFYVTIASLIVPSIVVSLGIGLEFRLIDDAIKALAESTGWGFLKGYETAAGLYTSALGAHLTWTLPFGLLILFAVFNRFNPAYEEAARDLGANPGGVLRHVVIPIIAPSLVGVALFGFTLSWDEVARTSQAIGGRNTLPLELQGLTTTVTTPEIYALGTVTTGMSLLVIGVALGSMLLIQRRRAQRMAPKG
ncbi:ABC transporter permease [Roseomonas sp. OT10]|uniref:ABC transporter permease n=1 Tax=Roseomonas cutis TaxID=2897332 RepID=UPI001E484A10|nr:ABC transporter permease [Roseomonas sp. OT10]UFN48082.1 ABC transporter permease [Roseomonas sp. OT10]